MDPTKIILDSGNWKDFKAKLSKLEPKEKGDCFELLTKAFLETDPRYTTKLQYVWHHSKVPTKTRRKLNLPAQDEGIDLVAKSREGEYWDIQCKYKTAEGEKEPAATGDSTGRNRKSVPSKRDTDPSFLCCHDRSARKIRRAVPTGVGSA